MVTGRHTFTGKIIMLANHLPKSIIYTDQPGHLILLQTSRIAFVV